MCQNRQLYAMRRGGNMTRQVFLRVLFYLEVVDKMWQRVVDSFDVVGCNYLLQSLMSASSHCEGGVT